MVESEGERGVGSGGAGGGGEWWGIVGSDGEGGAMKGGEQWREGQ